jgi:hypothetical protein
MAQSKKLLYKTLICLTIYEKEQISKSKPKKFWFLCTFKFSMGGQTKGENGGA